MYTSARPTAVVADRTTEANTSEVINHSRNEKLKIEVKNTSHAVVTPTPFNNLQLHVPQTLNTCFYTRRQREPFQSVMRKNDELETYAGAIRGLPVVSFNILGHEIQSAWCTWTYIAYSSHKTRSEAHNAELPGGMLAITHRRVATRESAMML
jgi:hypothetical protein